MRADSAVTDAAAWDSAELRRRIRAGHAWNVRSADFECEPVFRAICAHRVIESVLVITAPLGAEWDSPSGDARERRAWLRDALVVLYTTLDVAVWWEMYKAFDALSRVRAVARPPAARLLAAARGVSVLRCVHALKPVLDLWHQTGARCAPVDRLAVARNIRVADRFVAATAPCVAAELSTLCKSMAMHMSASTAASALAGHRAAGVGLFPRVGDSVRLLVVVFRGSALREGSCAMAELPDHVYHLQRTARMREIRRTTCAQLTLPTCGADRVALFGRYTDDRSAPRAEGKTYVFSEPIVDDASKERWLASGVHSSRSGPVVRMYVVAPDVRNAPAPGESRDSQFYKQRPCGDEDTARARRRDKFPAEEGV